MAPTPPHDQRPSSGRTRATITGVVACYNEESNIESCLSSLDWCDELVVVDSFSTDLTAEIAQQNPKVRFYQHAYYGDGAQRNWAINLVRTDWLLILDADERCPAALREEIEELLAAEPAHDAYTIPRRSYFLGRRIRFSGWQNDRVIRLVRHGAGYYSRRRVHARVVTSGPAPLLQNPLDHYMIECFHSYVRRINLYGYWGAAQCWRDGIRAGAMHVLIRPATRFVRTYLLQLGFLDGMRGLTFCMLQTYASYLKWSLLWSWHVNAARGRAPLLPEFDDDPTVWSGLRQVERRRAARARSSQAFPEPGRVTDADVASAGPGTNRA